MTRIQSPRAGDGSPDSLGASKTLSLDADATPLGRVASFFAEAFSLRGSGVRPEDSAAVEKAPSRLIGNL